MSTETNSRPAVVLCHVEADVAFGHSEDLFFILWRGRTTPQAMRALESGFAEVTATRSEPLGLLTTVTPETLMPEGEGKRRLAAFAHAASESAFISALICEGGDGADAARMRMGFVTGSLSLVARQSYPHRNFANLHDASAWLEAHSAATSHPLRAANVRAEYEAFRRLVADAAQPVAIGG